MIPLVVYKNNNVFINSKDFFLAFFTNYGGGRSGYYFFLLFAHISFASLLLNYISSIYQI